MKSILLSISLIFGSYVSAHSGVLPTSLKITVIDNLGNFVEGATVKLYLTEEDYRAETNQVKETLTTDEKGRVKFKEMEPIPYFMLVEFEKKSNIGNGVRTEPLQEGKVNKVNTIIQ